VPALLPSLRAAEAWDADRFGERLALAFLGAHGLGRPEAIAEIRRYFAAYESVAIDVYGTESERSGATARVRSVVEFSGQVWKAFGLEGLLPPRPSTSSTSADEGDVACQEPLKPAEASSRKRMCHGPNVAQNESISVVLGVTQ
jgi:hypothetical protein